MLLSRSRNRDWGRKSPQSRTCYPAETPGAAETCHSCPVIPCRRQRYLVTTRSSHQTNSSPCPRLPRYLCPSACLAPCRGSSADGPLSTPTPSALPCPSPPSYPAPTALPALSSNPCRSPPKPSFSAAPRGQQSDWHRLRQLPLFLCEAQSLWWWQRPCQRFELGLQHGEPQIAGSRGDDAEDLSLAVRAPLLTDLCKNQHHTTQTSAKGSVIRFLELGWCAGIHPED